MLNNANRPLRPRASAVNLDHSNPIYDSSSLPPEATRCANSTVAISAEAICDEPQYITQCVAGTHFGGWFRILPDGRLELSALGGVWHAPRRASLPQRQARAMLARLVRLRGVRSCNSQ